MAPILAIGPAIAFALLAQDPTSQPVPPAESAEAAEAAGRWALLMALLLGVLIGFVTAMLLVGRSRIRRKGRAGRRPTVTDLSVDAWVESAKRTPTPPAEDDTDPSSSPTGNPPDSGPDGGPDSNGTHR